MLTSKKKKVVVKLGSSLLTGAGGLLDRAKLINHVGSIASLKQAGHEVVLVSSGAIAAGFPELGYSERPKTVEQKQAAASVGQGILMHAYREAFQQFEIPVAQILLSRRDFAIRESYNNVLNTISLLLDKGALPIINENDSVATREITFGDNDMLSAFVATLIHADLLVILTDVEGLYSGNPRTDPSAARIPFVESVTEDLLALAGKQGSSVGTGGMLAKLKAAEVALSLGSRCYIGSGVNNSTDCLIKILEGSGKGTYIGNEPTPIIRRKQWLAYHSETKGRVIIDEGAKVALLEKKKSLLPVGVSAVIGDFTVDDVIEICGEDGVLLAKGISRLSSLEMRKVLKMSSEDAKRQIGKGKVEVVNRDNIVILGT